jgi:hypothetical protein
MKFIASVSIAFASVLLAACSSGSDAGKPSEREKILLDAAKRPLEQAGQMEKQIQDAAEAQRRQIEEQSQ